MKSRWLILFAAVFGLAAQTAPHSVKLTWAAPTSGAQPAGYSVMRSQSSGAEVTIGTTNATTLTYTDPFQTTNEGQTYFYVIEATGPGGSSKPSNEVSATIPFSVPGTPGTLSEVVQ